MEEQINTGARAILASMRVQPARWREISFVVAHLGWTLVPFVLIVSLVAKDSRIDWLAIFCWLSAYTVYQVLLEILSKHKKVLYETSRLRFVRMLMMALWGIVLVYFTGRAQSYFWIILLWPLFASVLYFERWTIMCYIVIAGFYIGISLAAAGPVAGTNIALLLVNLIVLLLFVVVFRYLMGSIQMYQALERKVWLDTAPGLQEVLDAVLKQAVALVDAKDGSLMLVNEKGDLYFRARVKGLVPKSKVERTFKFGEGIAGWVAENRKPHLCLDIENDPHFVSIVSGSPIRSLVSVPIISHGVLLGVVSVDSDKPKRFSMADVELLQTLAGQVVEAIERAQLLESLKQISESTLTGTQDVYEQIVAAVQRFTACPVALWQASEKNKAQATIRAHRGLRTEYVRDRILDLERSVTSKAIRAAEPIEVPNILEHPDVSPPTKEEAKKQDWKSMLVLPLLAKPGRAVGTLNIYSVVEKRFTFWEQNLLRIFASQAGVAIQNARLRQQEQTLHEIGQGIGVLGVEEISKLVYDKASQLMDTTNFSLCLYDKEKGQLDYKLWVYEGQLVEKVPPELTGLTGWVISEKKTLLINDWDKEEKDFPVKARIVTARQRSWLGVPLLVGEAVIGVMATQSPQPCAFDLETQRLLEAIASQAAIVIQNARLHTELYALGMEINRGGLKTEEIFQKTVQSIIRVSDASAANMLLLHDTDDPALSVSQPPTLSISKGLGEDYDDKVKPRPGGLTFHTLKHRTPQAVSHPDDSPGINPVALERGTLAYLCLPMKIQESIIGVLFVHYNQPHVFAKSEIVMLSLFANQAALAIENARQRERLEMSAAIAWTGITYSSLAHRITQQTATIRNLVWELCQRLQEQPDIVERLDSIDRFVQTIGEIPRQAQLPFKDQAEVNNLNDVLREEVPKWCAPDYGIELRFQLTTEDVFVRADRRRLAIVFEMLVPNAVRAMRDSDKKCLIVESTIRGGRAEIKITDTGKGIPKQVQERLFKEPIPKAQGIGENGVGLIITRTILVRYGGDVKLERTGPTGTTFLIELPLLRVASK